MHCANLLPGIKVNTRPDLCRFVEWLGTWSETDVDANKPRIVIKGINYTELANQTQYYDGPS